MLAVPGALVALGLAYLAALGTVGARPPRPRAAARPRRLAAATSSRSRCSRASALGLARRRARHRRSRSPPSTSPAPAAASAPDGALVDVRRLRRCSRSPARRRRGSARASPRSAAASARDGAASVARAQAALAAALPRSSSRSPSAGLVYWLTARTGFSAVVNPDSNPTLSLSVYMFLAPALLWIGAALLLVRLRGRLVAWLGRARGRAAARRRRPASCSRARAGAGPAINRGLLVLGLLLAFGVNLGIFAATYDQQARVDAQLTLGADVVATAPPGVVVEAGLAQRLARTAGRRPASPRSTTPTRTSARTCRTPSASTRRR